MTVDSPSRSTQIVTHQFDRRTLLRQAAGGVAASLLASTAPRPIAAAPASGPGPDQFKNQMRGPVLSIPTPFTSDLTIDYKGVERMIERAKPHGIRIFALTSGNGQYDSLKHDEIYELMRVVINAAGRESVALAATGQWTPEQTLEYAHFAAKTGANALQVMRPKEEDDEKVFQFYRDVAQGMDLPIVLHGEYSDSLLEKLISINSIVSMKEDVGLENYIHVQRKFGKRLAIFEGGCEYAYLVGYPYGSPAAYSFMATFAPQISRQFWDAIARDDAREAYRLVIKYEHPIFDRFSHEFWRATLEHFGVAARYLRPPQESFSDEQMKDVAKFYQELGLS